MTRAMDMRGDSRSVVRQRFSAGMSLSALCLALFLAAPAQAARQGHGRIVSAPGKPLEVVILEVELTPADIAALKASVAPAASWTQYGLTPPVAVETMRVAIAPGNSASSRTLVVTSDQPVDRPVVDILLDVATASGAGQVQVSFLVPTRAAAGAAGGSVVVARGDTLFAIAQRNAVEGATLYQVLWALYQANPQAFSQENMNLLRAGATLKIPDADTVRAVDPKYAQVCVCVCVGGGPSVYVRMHVCVYGLFGRAVGCCCVRFTPNTCPLLNPADSDVNDGCCRRTTSFNIANICATGLTQA